MFSAFPLSTTPFDAAFSGGSTADTHDGAVGAIRRRPLRDKYAAELAARRELHEAISKAARPAAVEEDKQAELDPASAEIAPPIAVHKDLPPDFGIDWEEEEEIAAIQDYAAQQSEALASQLDRLLASLPKPSPKPRDVQAELLASLKQFRQALKDARRPRQVVRDANGKILGIR